MARSKQSPKRVITADDLFRIVVVSDPQAAPDGQHIAWVQSRPVKEDDVYRAAIWISRNDGSDARQLTSGQYRDSAPQWSPDSQSLAFISNRLPTLPSPAPAEDGADARTENAKPNNQVWTIRIDGGEAAQQTNHPNGVSDYSWSPDGTTLAFSANDNVTEEDSFDASTSKGPIADERIVRDISYRFDGRGFLEKYAHIWTTRAGSGDSTQLTFGDATDSAPVWSPDGASLAFVSNRTADRKRFWNRNAIYVVSSSGGDPVSLTPDDAQFGLPAWSPSGDRIAFIGHLGTGSADNDTIWTINPDGANLTNLTDETDISFGDSGMSDLHTASYQGPRWIDDKTLLALASEAGRTQVYRIDTEKRSVQQVTTGDHRIAGFAPLAKDLVVVRGLIARPFELELWSSGNVARSISHANDEFLNEVELIDAMTLPVTAPDGQSIQTWLIPPHGYKAKSSAKHPLILQIHGGPHSMYGFSMFHEMQLMASRGYAVLFSNPRGSAGYGREFTSCTRGSWGDADMPDVVAAVDAASALPWIDTDRLGITGGSYGGYLTNWVIGHDDRFKAAVTQRCVSNFHSFFGTSDIGTTFGVSEFDGLPWSDAEKLLRHSPISYVDKINTPLLILHSEQDLRCPIEQAEQMFASLKYLDREVAFVRVPEEGHELSRSGTPSRRLARLHHLIGWFDQHI